MSTNLKSNELVVNHNLFGQKVGTYRRLVLARELLTHKPIHQGRLTNPSTAHTHTHTYMQWLHPRTKLIWRITGSFISMMQEDIINTKAFQQSLFHSSTVLPFRIFEVTSFGSISWRQTKHIRALDIKPVHIIHTTKGYLSPFSSAITDSHPSSYWVCTMLLNFIF